MTITEPTPSHASISRWPRLGIVLVFGFLWYVCLRGLRMEWTVNYQYQHGWAVPFLALYLIWDALKHPPESRSVKPTLALPGWLATALFIWFAAALLPTRLIEEANPGWRLVRWLLAVEVLGLSLLALRFARGAAWTRHLAFPLAYILVAVPWPTAIEAPVIQTLTRAVSILVTELMNLVGVPALRHGNVIEISAGVVGIEEACSGIRSFQATLMFSLALGQIYRLNVPRRCLLVALGFAAAFLLNILRTSLLVWTASARGVEAVADWHDTTGFSVLAGSFVLLWLASFWFKRRQGGSCAAPAKPVLADEVPSPRNSPSGRWLPWLAVWLAVVEVGVEAWYRWHERRVPPSVEWTFVPPAQAAGFREIPLPKEVRGILRYDEGVNVAWRGTDTAVWQAIFLRWLPGRVSVLLARNHTPEICIAATGREVHSLPGLRWVDAGGLQLPFRAYEVHQGAAVIHVFYCLWEDRAVDRTFETEHLTYENRFASVRAGRRNLGQRSLEVILHGQRNVEQAEEALRLMLKEQLRVIPAAKSASGPP